MDGSDAAAIRPRSNAPLTAEVPVTGEAALLGRWLVNCAILALGDGVVLAMALLIAGAARTVLLGSPVFPPWAWLLPPVWWCGALAVRLIPGWGLGVVEELRRTVLLLATVFAATTTILFLLQRSEQISRLTVSVAFLLCLPLLPYTRARLKAFLVRQKLWGMPCVVCGDAPSIEMVLAALRQEPGLGYVPVAIHPVDDEPRDAAVDGVPTMSETALEGMGAMAAILALRDPSPKRLADLLEGPLVGFRRVIVVPDFVDAPALWGQPRDIGGVLGLEISRNLQDAWARTAKRAFDLALVLLLAPLWFPAVLVIAGLIAILDRQNPIFIHRRVGVGGHEFPMWKFRTMRGGAEETLRKQLRENDELKRQWEANFKLPEDPRVTPLGRFLRKTSLDELPQFLHVLRGEMSAVGPRPLPAYHACEIPERLRVWRATVRPGMTGLWQVSGRSDAGTDGIIKSDSYYLRHWSIWLDIVILARTLRVIWRRTGAY